MNKRIAKAEEGSGYQHILTEVSDDVVMVKNFSDMKPFTMTCVVQLKGSILDLNSLLLTFPVRSTMIDYSLQPGSIVSFRYNGYSRGKSGGYFSNSAIVDVHVREKKTQVSVKISSDNIQMTGCKNLEMGEEVAGYITDAVNGSVEFIKYVRNNISLFNAAVNWLKGMINGKMFTYIKRHEDPHTGMVFIDDVEDWSIAWPSLDSIPKEYETMIHQIMIRNQDVLTVGSVMQRIFYYPLIDPDKMSQSLSICKAGRSMVNYNYTLGFGIDRR